MHITTVADTFTVTVLAFIIIAATVIFVIVCIIIVIAIVHFTLLTWPHLRTFAPRTSHLASCTAPTHTPRILEC